MLMRAPGKLVLSGAYAVLEGAPALVSAVDRYVVADSSRTSPFTTPEFAAAHTNDAQPLFDANQLRDNGEKLGLGSSAAILVACLGALRAHQAPELPLATLRRSVFDEALAAHRAAQGGGSGVDVAASSFGGTLLARRANDGRLKTDPIELDRNLHWFAWATGHPASTTALIKAVFDLKRRAPFRYRHAMDRQSEAAEHAAKAVGRGSGLSLLAALDRQHHALERLGREAGVDIVVDAARQLHELATRTDAVVLPAGAGGGDITFYAGLSAPSPELLALAGRLGQKPLHLAFGAEGLGPSTHPPRNPEG